MTSSPSPFAQPTLHQKISGIITKRSSNQNDIRDVALEGIDLTQKKSILDLGCGFGFMAAVMADRVSPEARILGIDACLENRDPYLQQIEPSGRLAEFRQQNLCDELPFADAAFDLVLASYSLYFFPRLIPEIARVLSPDGLFLTITHSRRSFRSLLAACELEAQPLVELLERFCVENGRAALDEHFGEVQLIEYPNQLVFDHSDLGELMTYVRFKAPFMCFPERRSSPKMQEILGAYLKRESRLLIEKDDGVFRCWRGPTGA